MAGVSRVFRLSLALFLAVVVIVTGLAEGATRSRQYPHAVQLFGDSGESWARLSGTYLAKGEKEKSREAATNALRYSLGHVEALTALGITDFDAGKKETGSKLVQLAADLSWRDSASQSWLFQQALIGGDYAKAMRHADALLRREKAQDEIFGVFNLAAMDPKLIAPLIKQFEDSPNWRARYFSFAKRSTPDQYVGVENIIAALKDSKTPTTREELTPYTSMLISKKQHARALNLWNEHFPDAMANGETRLYWSNVVRSSEMQPSDWRITSNRNIRASVSGDLAGASNSLSIDLERGALGELAWRYILAKPDGDIRLKLDSGYASQGLRWSVTCLSSGSKTYFSAESESPSVWQAPITAGCEVYKLALELKLGGVQGSEQLRLPSVSIVS